MCSYPYHAHLLKFMYRRNSLSFGSLFVLAAKIGFSAENLVLDVVGDIQGYSLSTLQELGVVNPVLGSALWKSLQTSLDALTKSIWKDEHGAMKGTQSTCPADTSPVRHLVPRAAPRETAPGSPRALLQGRDHLHREMLALSSHS